MEFWARHWFRPSWPGLVFSLQESPARRCSRCCPFSFRSYRLSALDWYGSQRPFGFFIKAPPVGRSFWPSGGSGLATSITSSNLGSSAREVTCRSSSFSLEFLVAPSPLGSSAFSLDLRSWL